MLKRIKKFTAPSRSSYEAKQRSIVMGLVFGVFGLIPAIVVVILANSLTVLSDLLRNVGMVFAIFFSWMTVQRVAKGKNPIYNYGYGKMENISSLVVAGVMLVSITIVVLQTVERFRDPQTMGTVGMGLGTLFSGLAALFNAWLWIQSYKAAKKENSPVMESLYRLYQVKTISTLCVVSSLGLSLLFKDQSWAVYIDPCGSVVLLGFMVFTTWGVISSSVFDLLDRTLSDSLQLIVLNSLAAHFDSYEAIHAVRSRRAGNVVYVELFLEFDPDQKMSEVQKNIDAMRNELQVKMPGSQIVVVPATTPP
jgi:ferrous-iron efflux pump FieF